MYFFLSFIPVLINIILFPFVYIYGWQDVLLNYDLVDINLGFNELVVPIYLLIVNILTLVKTSKKSGTCIFITCLVICINNLMHYINWGIRTGLLLNPDSESVMFAIYFGAVFPILFVLFGMLIFHIIRKLTARKKV